MKKVLTFPQTIILFNFSLPSTVTIMTIMILIIKVQSAENNYPQGKGVHSSHLHRAQPVNHHGKNNYLKPNSANFHSLYADPSRYYKRMGTILKPLPSSGSISSDVQFNSNIRLQPYAQNRQGTSHITLTNEGANVESPPVESQPEETRNEEDAQEEDNNPFEQVLEDLTTPGKIIPIINYFTVIALVILHLPAIVPTIFIPLAFFCVGALLIPIVRVNYFINHKDDGEDGRRSFDFISSLITTSSNVFHNILS